MIGPGIHTISAETYHADDLCETPSLSKSVLHTLLTRSPLHARAKHPRLNPDFVRENKKQFDLGNLAHALFLDDQFEAVVVDAADWKTKAAQTQRDEAYALGRIPALRKEWDAALRMAEAARIQVDGFQDAPPLFDAGKPEQTLVWEEDGVMCRARLDWLRDDLLAIDDYKTTATSAHPDRWPRKTMFDIGGDLQVAFYLRGMAALTGFTPDWRFVVQENYPPYALSVVSLTPGALELAQKRVASAIRTWRSCMESGLWAPYTLTVTQAGSPSWLESEWAIREAIGDV